jgi:pimeloyl-ACP methyl ester carboxylesterase
MNASWGQSGIRSLLLVALALTAPAYGVDDPQKSESTDNSFSFMRLNIPTWTLGGKQFWTDGLIHGQWRIQRNVISGHYRLLDGMNFRRAWGSWDRCFERWKQLRVEKQVAPLSKKVVILIHGLGRSRGSMKNMAEYLTEHGDYSVLSFSYASTRSPLADDAQSLGKVLEHLDGVEEIYFVAHSMGNLVVRHLLGDQLAASQGLGIDHRISRIVMLAPPNNGAALARRFKDNAVFKLIFATGGKEFAENWAALQTHLVTPSCQFGIVAGGAKDGDGHNPLLKGNDDMVVTVQETRLPGAHDFVVLPVAHTFIMDDETVQQYTLRFLEHGYFVAQDRRQPLDEQAAQE